MDWRHNDAAVLPSALDHKPFADNAVRAVRKVLAMPLESAQRKISERSFGQPVSELVRAKLGVSDTVGRQKRRLPS
jgi:hypothetical protein